MAKSIRVESGNDRISALSDDLLSHILSFIPTKSAVCVSILSTRWRYLYTLVSSIEIKINRRLSYPENFSRFVTFVEKDLLSCDKRSVQRFHLKWYGIIDRFPVNKWIDALMCHSIQELELCNEVPRQGSCPVLPDSLYSSETLVVLKLVIGLDDHSLKIPDKASLPNLKVLNIRQTTISSDQIEKLLSGCPVLDDFCLGKCWIEHSNGPFKLDITHASVKRLTIQSFSSSRAVEAVINLPALEYLSFDFHGNQSLILLAKQSLAEVVISSEFMRLPEDYANAHEHDVLKEINDIQSLQILDYSLQGMHKCNLALPLFENLTHLKLSDSIFLYNPRCLEYILAPCVVLETLVFELHRPAHLTILKTRRMKCLLQQSRLAGLLCHLKTIKFQLWEIEDAEAENLMKIIKFFLNNAKILEELTICIKCFRNTQQPKMMAELSKIPRVSKNCRVVLNNERVIVNTKSYIAQNRKVQ